MSPQWVYTYTVQRLKQIGCNIVHRYTVIYSTKYCFYHQNSDSVLAQMLQGFLGVVAVLCKIWPSAVMHDDDDCFKIQWLRSSAAEWFWQFTSKRAALDITFPVLKPLNMKYSCKFAWNILTKFAEASSLLNITYFSFPFHWQPLKYDKQFFRGKKKKKTKGE